MGDWRGEMAFLTVRQVAERLGLAKPDTVLRWIAAGELVAVNVGSGPARPTWRIDPADLDRFLDRRRAAPRPAVPRRTRRPAAGAVTKYF